MLLRDLIVLDSFCMKGQGTAVKFAFMKIVLCTVAFFILFSSILYKYIYIYRMNFGVSYFYFAPPLPHLNTCTTLRMNIP